MTSIKRTCILLILVILAAGRISLQGQPVKAQWEAARDSILIGDHLPVSFSVTQDPTLRVSFPLFADTLAGMEILRLGEKDTSIDGGSLQIVQELTLTAFEQGPYLLPAVEVSYRQRGDTSRQVTSSDDLPITVVTVPVDTAEGFRPIKDVARAPLSFSEVWPYGLILLILVAAGIWLYRRYKQPKPEQIEVKKAQSIPPHEQAMRALSRIEQEKLWQNGEVKEYFDRVTDVLRTYVEEKFGVPAMESITSEILRQLRNSPLSLHQRQKLGEMLETADLAKFAKVRPGATECLAIMDAARQFVKDTRTLGYIAEDQPQNAMANPGS